jgi:murein DD-endopeptidase MepM/ murein hydrolase activator NlpD
MKMEIQSQDVDVQKASLSAQLQQFKSKESFEALLQQSCELPLNPAALAERLDASFMEALEAHVKVVELGEAADDNVRAQADGVALLAAYEGLHNRKVLNRHGDDGKLISGNDYKALQIARVLEYANEKGDTLITEAVQSLSRAYDIEITDARGRFGQASSKLGLLKESIMENPRTQRAFATAAFLTASSVVTVATASPAAADVATVNITPTTPSPNEREVLDGRVVKISAKNPTASTEVVTALEKNGVSVTNIKSKPVTGTPIAPKPAEAVEKTDDQVVVISKANLKSPKKVQGSKTGEVKKDDGNVIKIKPIPVVPTPAAPAAPVQEAPAPPAAIPAIEAPAPGASLEVLAAQALTKINHNDLPEHIRNVLPKNTNWNNIGRMMEYLIVHGKLSDSQAIGPVANATLESAGLNPGQSQIGGPAFGIVQWEGPRRTALEAYAAAQNKPVDDLYVQLDFMLMELERDGWNGFAELKQAKNSSEATLIFLNKFERPSIPHQDRRLAISKIITDIYNEKWHALEAGVKQTADAKAAAKTAANNAVTASHQEKRVEEFTGWHHPVPVGSRESKQYAGHKGVDYAVPSGTPFYAAVGGTVKVLEYNVKDEQFCKDAFNNIGASMDVIKDPIQKEVRITRTIGKDKYEVIYAHMSEIDVKDGQIVNGNDQIGKTGNSGCSTGDHAHFEIRVNGVPVNPNVLFGQGIIQPMGEIKVSASSISADETHPDEHGHDHDGDSETLSTEQQRRLDAIKQVAELKARLAATEKDTHALADSGYLSIQH